MSLKTAAFFAMVGAAIWTILKAVVFFRDLSGVIGGFVPSMTLFTSLIELIAVLSLLVFFAVFYRRHAG